MLDPTHVQHRLPLRTLNGLLRTLERAGLIKQPLETERLIQTARRRVGLTEFGDETFREPLGRLLESCENEARLNHIGKLALIEDTLQLLTNRLEIERDPFQRLP